MIPFIQIKAMRLKNTSYAYMSSKELENMITKWLGKKPDPDEIILRKGETLNTLLLAYNQAIFITNETNLQKLAFNLELTAKK